MISPTNTTVPVSTSAQNPIIPVINIVKQTNSTDGFNYTKIDLNKISAIENNDVSKSSMANVDKNLDNFISTLIFNTTTFGQDSNNTNSGAGVNNLNLTEIKNIISNVDSYVGKNFYFNLFRFEFKKIKRTKLTSNNKFI